MKGIRLQIETVLLELNSGVIEPEQEVYVFIIKDEDGAQMRSARLEKGKWILNVH